MSLSLKLAVDAVGGLWIQFQHHLHVLLSSGLVAHLQPQRPPQAKRLQGEGVQVHHLVEAAQGLLVVAHSLLHLRLEQHGVLRLRVVVHQPVGIGGGPFRVAHLQQQSTAKQRGGTQLPGLIIARLLAQRDATRGLSHGLEQVALAAHGPRQLINRQGVVCFYPKGFVTDGGHLVVVLRHIIDVYHAQKNTHIVGLRLTELGQLLHGQFHLVGAHESLREIVARLQVVVEF